MTECLILKPVVMAATVNNSFAYWLENTVEIIYLASGAS
jgi:hypothetical protein